LPLPLISSITFINTPQISNMDQQKKTKAWEKFSKLIENSDESVITYLVRAYSMVIQESQESTIQGLTTFLDENHEYLLQKLKESDKALDGRTSLSLESAYKIFKSYLIKNLKHAKGSDIESIKNCFYANAKEFEKQTKICKDLIKDFAHEFIKNGITIFVYGYSRLVEYVLRTAAEKNLRFSVICAETRPRSEGYDMYTALSKRVPVKMVVDSAIAYALEDADIVLVGAEAVVENGGIINRIGTYTTAICAKMLKKPLYVVSESFKFTRAFPLSQKDLPDSVLSDKTFEAPEHVKEKLEQHNIKGPIQTINPLCDYTPPELITLIFTDIGIFTPSAVSDELIQIFDV